MDSVKLTQVKPLKIKILGGSFFLIISYLLYVGNAQLSQISILFVIGTLLLGYSVVYEVSKDFKNYVHFCLFNLTFFKYKLNFPEYIAVFATSQSGDNEWGTVSALGTKERYEMVVVRFFSGTNKFTVFKSNSYNVALDKATEISQMLKVEVHDATKN